MLLSYSNWSISNCFTDDGDIDMPKIQQRRRVIEDEFDSDSDDFVDGTNNASSLPITISLGDCFSAISNLIEEKYLQRRKLQVKEDAAFDDEEGIPDKAPPKKRSKRMPILARRTENGELEEIPPTESMWYSQYVSTPNVSSKRFQQKFCRRFRLPFSAFNDFVAYIKDGNYLPQWMGCNAAGKPASPIELMILGALRYLGRGWTFDDNEEATAVSEETHRRFFHKFIEFGSTVLFEKYVRTPRTTEEIKTHMAEFELAGLPGACASSDATFIVHEMLLNNYN